MAVRDSRNLQRLASSQLRHASASEIHTQQHAHHPALQHKNDMDLQSWVVGVMTCLVVPGDALVLPQTGSRRFVQVANGGCWSFQVVSGRDAAAKCRFVYHVFFFTSQANRTFTGPHHLSSYQKHYTAP
jgi:hypothetical protein